MSGLFSNLYNFMPRSGKRKPAEDFFTELFAYVLRKNPGLLMAWLRSLNTWNQDLESAETPTVLTQAELAKLKGHKTASRPDLWISVPVENGSILFLCEHKTGSGEGEGEDQLQRYAEHLKRESSYKGTLLYLEQ